jgi:cytochrome c biogenesis protein CcmG, thiol:disulfide interchange protein DsbE
MNLRHLIAAVGLASALAFGACGGGEDDVGNPESEVSVEDATAPLEGGSPELRELRAEANQLLGGGVAAFEERLASLEGAPVVINKWASWCGPCRFEFPFFQSQAEKRGAEVAFLGIDSNDSEDAAVTFLEELPLPYPSYLDPDQELADEFLDNAREFPATAFYDSGGELAYVHLGAYPDEESLAADIDRYAQYPPE